MMITNKLEKVPIQPNANGDSRTAGKVPTFEEFQEANDMHISDVNRVMWSLGRFLMDRGELHDITKKVLERMFYEDMKETIENGSEFTEGQWAKIHYENSIERHHLHRTVPEDVNLIDVLEMICDCVCAGKARSEKNNVTVELDTDILELAYQNTVQMINESVVLEKPAVVPAINIDAGALAGAMKSAM